MSGTVRNAKDTAVAKNVSIVIPMYALHTVGGVEERNARTYILSSRV